MKADTFSISLGLTVMESKNVLLEKMRTEL